MAVSFASVALLASTPPRRCGTYASPTLAFPSPSLRLEAATAQDGPSNVSSADVPFAVHPLYAGKFDVRDVCFHAFVTQDQRLIVAKQRVRVAASQHGRRTIVTMTTLSSLEVTGSQVLTFSQVCCTNTQPLLAQHHGSTQACSDSPTPRRRMERHTRSRPNIN